jgi:hypothetical protein
MHDVPPPLYAECPSVPGCRNKAVYTFPMNTRGISLFQKPKKRRRNQERENKTPSDAKFDIKT